MLSEDSAASWPCRWSSLPPFHDIVLDSSIIILIVGLFSGTVTAAFHFVHNLHLFPLSLTVVVA